MGRKNRRSKPRTKFSLSTKTLNGSRVSDNVRYTKPKALDEYPQSIHAMNVLERNKRKNLRL